MQTLEHPHGYCWAEHPEGGPRCTLDPGHEGDHHDWYARGAWRDWPASSLTH